MFLIKEPVLTEKTFNGIEKNNVYVFLVDPRAKKPAIKRQVEYIFNVKVKKVNTLREPRKSKRIHRNTGYLPRFKRAILTLEKGYGITIFPQEPKKDLQVDNNLASQESIQVANEALNLTQQENKALSKKTKEDLTKAKVESKDSDFLTQKEELEIQTPEIKKESQNVEEKDE